LLLSILKHTAEMWLANSSRSVRKILAAAAVVVGHIETTTARRLVNHLTLSQPKTSLPPQDSQLLQLTDQTLMPCVWPPSILGSHYVLWKFC
jgi:hypothetical protein